MITRLLSLGLPGCLLLLQALSLSAAQIEILGKHPRADGSLHNFEVLDGDALSPGDRFQIIINAKNTTYYAIVYFSRAGEAVQIFPPAGKRGRIKAGKKQYIPDANNYFTLDESAGRELMFVVTGPDPLNNLKSVLKRAAEGNSSPVEIQGYLQKRLPAVHKLEITNTGKKITGLTDQVASSLVHDIARTYAANPWTESADGGVERERKRRTGDTSIPEEVRRRAQEVRSLLRRPRGTPDSSSLRTIRTAEATKIEVAPTSNEQGTTDRVRADASMDLTPIAAEKTAIDSAAARQAEEEQRLARERQQRLAAAKAEQERAEAEAQRLHEEKEVAKRLEKQRAVEALAAEKRLREQREAIARSEAEAKRQAEMEISRIAAEEEVQRQEEQRLAQLRAEAEAKRLQEEKLEDRRLEIARLQAERAEAEAKRLQEERAEATRLQAAQEKAARLAAETRRIEQERIAAEKARQEAQRLEANRLAAEKAAEKERRLQAERQAAEKAAKEARRLEAERIALAEAEAETKRLQAEREAAEAARLEKERAEFEVRRVAEQRAAEEARRIEEERQAQLLVEAEAKRLEEERVALERRLQAEQEEAERQIEKQAEVVAAADKPEEKTEEKQSLLGGVLAFFDKDKSETSDDSNEIKIDSTGEIITEEEVAPAVNIPNQAAQAPKEAVVVLQAPARLEQKKMTAPAPKRITVTGGKAPSEESLRALYAQIASAIVSIRTRNDPQAAGFVLDQRGHVLTGWHVVNGVTDIDVEFMAISGASRVYKAKVVKLDKFRDLALLELIDPPAGIQPIALSAQGLPDAGETVRVFGQRDGQIWATDNATITRIAENFTWFSTDNVIHRGEVLQVDLPAEGKDIGALVTNMDYEMLGVKSFSGRETGRTYAVSVGTIREFVTSGKAAPVKP